MDYDYDRARTKYARFEKGTLCAMFAGAAVAGGAIAVMAVGALVAPVIVPVTSVVTGAGLGVMFISIVAGTAHEIGMFR
jgi:hypothetical protein